MENQNQNHVKIVAVVLRMMLNKNLYVVVLVNHVKAATRHKHVSNVMITVKDAKADVTKANVNYQKEILVVLQMLITQIHVAHTI